MYLKKAVLMMYGKLRKEVGFREIGLALCYYIQPDISDIRSLRKLKLNTTSQLE